MDLYLTVIYILGTELVTLANWSARLYYLSLHSKNCLLCINQFLQKNNLNFVSFIQYCFLFYRMILFFVYQVLVDKMGFIESHHLMDGRLIICTIAVAFAMFALIWDYLKPFPLSRPILIICVLAYPSILILFLVLFNCNFDVFLFCYI